MKFNNEAVVSCDYVENNERENEKIGWREEESHLIQHNLFPRVTVLSNNF